jgi:thiamine biosynthesis protein ThiI
LRPLVTSDKEEIIRTAARIGTEEFAAAMPEYCGVISVHPTTRARPERVTEEETHFDFSIIERAVAAAVVQDMEELAEEDLQRPEVEVLGVPLADSVVIDIRHPSEEELHPLKVHAEVLKIPFYELHGRVAELEPSRTYMLYCDRGVISKLHAGHLAASGYPNFKVLRPI